MKTKLLIALLTLLAVVLAACGPGGTAAKVSSVKINEGDQTLMVGQTFKFTVAVAVTGTAAQTVTWSSSDETVAEVAADGTVTAKAEGEAVITATSTFDKTKSDSVTVTVVAAGEPAVNAVVINEGAESVSVAEGETVDLTVSVDAVGGADTSVTWMSEDETIATVDENGVVTGVAEGETTVTATSVFDPTKSDSILVIVTAVGEPVINGVIIEGGADSVSVVEGGSRTLSVEVDAEAGANTNVTWMSSDESVVMVDSTGTVTAVGTAGQSATVTATSVVDPTKSDSILVNIVSASSECPAGEQCVTIDFVGSGTGQVYVNGFGPYTEDTTVPVAESTAIIQTAGGTVIAWGGDCAQVRNASQCTLTMDGDKTVSIAFSSGNEMTASASITNANLPSGSSDDVEEFIDGLTSVNSAFVPGYVYMDSTKLELTFDPRGTDQLVGLRFRDLDIPQGSTILSAYLKFRSAAASNDDPAEEPLVLTIEAQDSTNAQAFTNILRNVSNTNARPRLGQSVQWKPAAWGTGTVSAAESPNLAPILQALVNKGTWDNTNNAVVFIISSNDTANHRTADSAESSGTPPQLVVIYEPPAP